MENFEGNGAADREAKRSANRYGHPPPYLRGSGVQTDGQEKGGRVDPVS